MVTLINIRCGEWGVSMESFDDPLVSFLKPVSARSDVLVPPLNFGVVSQSELLTFETSRWLQEFIDLDTPMQKISSF